MKILQNLHKEGKTIVMVTHEEDIAQLAERQIVLKMVRSYSIRDQKEPN